MRYEIAFESEPEKSDLGVLEAGLNRHTEEIFGPREEKHIAFFVKDERGEIAGGVAGNYNKFGWLYVAMLWVRDDLRGMGYGSRLMMAIEDEAARHGCTNAFLNTMSFQAPEFYKKLGYTVWAELKEFPPGHSRFYMRKSLV